MAGNNPTIEVDLELDTNGSDKKIERQLENSGKRAGDNFSSGFNVGLGTIVTAVAAVRSLLAGVDFFKQSIAAAAQQQVAINALNTQLQITGQYTEQTSIELQNYASELQNVTRFGDEAVLSQLAFAQAMGASVEQSKDIVSAAADMSAALNIDFNSAVRNVSKTLGGYAGELGEVIPELKNLTAEQLQAGQGIDLLAAKFAGSATGEIRTFAGVIEQFKNVFGDFQESIGSFVTSSPALVAAIGETSKLFNQLKLSIDGLSTGRDLFADLLSGVLATANSLSYLIQPFEIFINVATAAVNVFKTGIQGVAAAAFSTFEFTIGNILTLLGKLPGSVGENARAASEALTNIAETAREVLAEQSEETLNSLVNVDQVSSFQENIQSIISGYQDAINKSRELKKESNQSFGSINKTVAKTSVDIAKSLEAGLERAAVSSIQGMTKALMNGELSFQNFGKLFLGVLGDLATQMGTVLIGAGIGIESLKALGGAAAIAAGVGLVALGAVLSSLSSGATTSSSSTSYNPATGESGDTTLYSPTTTEERETPTTGVTVNIQGDVLDSDESGIRLVRILENASLNENVRVVGGLA